MGSRRCYPRQQDLQSSGSCIKGHHWTISLALFLQLRPLRLREGGGWPKAALLPSQPLTNLGFQTILLQTPESGSLLPLLVQEMLRKRQINVNQEDVAPPSLWTLPFSVHLQKNKDLCVVSWSQIELVSVLLSWSYNHYLNLKCLLAKDISSCSVVHYNMKQEIQKKIYTRFNKISENL